MPVCQKMGIVLENKVVQKLKLEKIVFEKNGLLNEYSKISFFLKKVS
jgi:hypothetical protein